MTYRHVLFDIDGTLIDTEQMLITVFSDVLRRRYRCELTIDMFRSTFGLPCDVALRAIGLEPQQSVMDEIQQGIRRSLHLARLFPGIDELIPTLEEAFRQDVPSVIVVPVDYSENMKLSKHLKQVCAQK